MKRFTLATALLFVGASAALAQTANTPSLNSLSLSGQAGTGPGGLGLISGPLVLVQSWDSFTCTDEAKPVAVIRLNTLTKKIDLSCEAVAK